VVERRRQMKNKFLKYYRYICLVMGQQHQVLDGEKQRLKEMAFKCHSLDELLIVGKQINYNYYVHYAEKPNTKQREFRSAIDTLNINLQGKTMLDIGPGTGDSMDVAKQMGATYTFFIDGDPFFYKHNKLKGHDGILRDYTYYPFIKLNKKFDFIWLKGSTNSDMAIIEQNISVNTIKQIIKRIVIKPFNFEKWVDELINLLNPGGQILLLPAARYQETAITDPEYDLTTNYWVPDVPTFEKSRFSTILFKAGFQPIRDIPYYNQPLAFPLAFHYINTQLDARNI